MKMGRREQGRRRRPRKNEKEIETRKNRGKVR